MTTLPTSCRWIVIGDFNMVEARQDKTNPCGRLVPNGERLIFQALKAHFQIFDYPRSPTSARFSWDNFRPDGRHILARLDRYYLFTATQIRKILSYVIRGDYSWSNHRPVELQLGARTRNRPGLEVENECVLP
jgi:hypothetical protein